MHLLTPIPLIANHPIPLAISRLYITFGPRIGLCTQILTPAGNQVEWLLRGIEDYIPGDLSEPKDRKRRGWGTGRR